jgi:hypothetical protein
VRNNERYLTFPSTATEAFLEVSDLRNFYLITFSTIDDRRSVHEYPVLFCPKTSTLYCATAVRGHARADGDLKPPGPLCSIVGR